MKLITALALICTALAATSPRADTLPAASGFALDGMAPAGRWAARLTLLQNGYERRFDNEGKRRDLDADYDGLPLIALHPAFSGTLRLNTRVATEYSELMLGYGATDNLTLGAIIPYTRTTTHVRYGVEGGISTATLNGILGAIGYKPPRTSVSGGISDPTLGVLWRFHKGERDSAILGLGVRLGLAKADDPDDLFDVPPGDGSTDLRTRLEYFRDLGQQFDLRLLAEYQIQLPDHVRMRAGHPLLTPQAERLRRDLGDYWEYDLEIGKRLGNWRASATWHRYQEAPDRYWSAQGSDTHFLSDNTATRADQLRLGISWSGIDAWRAGQLPLPLIVKLEMQDAVAGRNFVGVRDIYLRLSTFF